MWSPAIADAHEYEFPGRMASECASPEFDRFRPYFTDPGHMAERRSCHRRRYAARSMLAVGLSLRDFQIWVGAPASDAQPE